MGAGASWKTLKSPAAMFLQSTFPGPLSVPPVRPAFDSSLYSSPNEHRSLASHLPHLVGCADLSLSRSTQRHSIRKWVCHLISVDHSGPFGFWSLQRIHSPKPLRRNSERSRPRGITVAQRDVRSGCSCRSPFINLTSIVPHIKSRIRCKMPFLCSRNIKSCFVYGPFSPHPFPLLISWHCSDQSSPSLFLLKTSHLVAASTTI